MTGFARGAFVRAKLDCTCDNFSILGETSNVEKGQKGLVGDSKRIKVPEGKTLVTFSGKEANEAVVVFILSENIELDE